MELLKQHLRELETLDGIAQLLSWDEATYMPKKAASLRGEQSALVASMIHARKTDPRIADWLLQLDGSDAVQRACKRNLERSYAREKKLDPALVAELAQLRARGFEAWIEAKKDNDFARFAPVLEELVNKTIERARAIDADAHPYDVQLQDYDPGTYVRDLRSMFARLLEGLVPLIAALKDKPSDPNLPGTYPLEAQWNLSRSVARAIGYDDDAGRLDASEHPFSVSFGPGDARITTRLSEADLLTGLGGTIHETGHAMYEQGLPAIFSGTTLREAASFGLHESQSRFWENTVGRSRAFSGWLFTEMGRHFDHNTMSAISPDKLYRALNRVEPGFIRIAADEATYNLHIVIRFELELALFEGSLRVRDLPEAWREKYRKYLGITPKNDSVGCLQDVHWSQGLFGYFPSYTLGNAYAASLGAQMKLDLPFDTLVAKGDFAPILQWLRKNVHEHGHLLEAPQIVAAAAPGRDPVNDLLDYLWQRHGELSGVVRPT